MEGLCPRCGHAIADGSICSIAAIPMSRMSRPIKRRLSWCRDAEHLLALEDAEMFDSISEHKDSQRKSRGMSFLCCELRKWGTNRGVTSNKATEEQEETSDDFGSQKSSKTATYLGIAVCAVLVILIKVYGVSIASLKKRILRRDWYALDDSIIQGARYFRKMKLSTDLKLVMSGWIWRLMCLIGNQHLETRWKYGSEIRSASIEFNSTRIRMFDALSSAYRSKRVWNLVSYRMNRRRRKWKTIYSSNGCFVDFCCAVCCSIGCSPRIIEKPKNCATKESIWKQVRFFILRGL